MKKIHLKHFLFYSIILLNLIVIGHYFTKHQMASKESQSIVLGEHPPQDYNLLHLATNFFLQELSNGKFLNSEILLKTSAGDIKPLGSVVSKKTCLVLYINNQNCNVCIESELRRLKLLSDKYKLQSNIIVINRETNIRHQKVFEIEHGFEAFSIISETLDLPVESKSTPFYFVLNTDLQVLGTYLSDNEEFYSHFFESYILAFIEKSQIIN